MRGWDRVSPLEGPIPDLASGNLLTTLSVVLAVLGMPVIAAFASWSVRYHLHQMGVPTGADDEGWPAISWPAFFGAVTFWAVLALGLTATTNAVSWNFASEVLLALFNVVVRFGVAGAILASGSWLAEKLEEMSDDPVRDRRVVYLGSGVFAAAALVGVGTAVLVLVGLGLLGLMAGSRNLRAQFADKLLDIAAGIRLRASEPVPSRIELGAQPVEISSIGLFNTTVEEGGVEKVLRNEAVLGLVDQP